MTTITELFPSSYLTAADFPTPRTMTISRWQLEKMPNSSDQKPVLYFSEEQRGLCLNKTNAESIAGIIGSPVMEQWMGRRIELFATQTQFGNKGMVPCIRVRAGQNGAVQQQAVIPQQPAVPAPIPPVPQQGVPSQPVQQQQPQQPLSTMDGQDSVPWA